MAGLTESTLCQKLVDSLVALLWTTHLVVMYWRGTWNLLDLYVLPGNSYLGSWLSYCGGITLCVIINTLFPYLDRHVTRQNKVRYFCAVRMCTYLLALGTVSQWRGIWNLQNEHMDLRWQSNTLCFSAAISALWLLRASLNTLTPPMITCCDLRARFFKSEPRLRSQPDSNLWNYAVDQLLSQAVIVSLVVTAWRGLWNVLNDLVLPAHFVHSNLVTWWGGLGVGVLLFALERPLSILSSAARQHHIGLQLLLDNLYSLVGIGVCIAVWRGWWNLLEVELIPGQLVGGWVCHVIGYLGLLLTALSGSLYNYTTLIDAEEPTGLHWSVEYLRFLIKMKQPHNESNGVSSLQKNEQENGRKTNGVDNMAYTIT